MRNIFSKKKLLKSMQLFPVNIKICMNTENVKKMMWRRKTEWTLSGIELVTFGILKSIISQNFDNWYSLIEKAFSMYSLFRLFWKVFTFSKLRDGIQSKFTRFILGDRHCKKDCKKERQCDENIRNLLRFIKSSFLPHNSEATSVLMMPK